MKKLLLSFLSILFLSILVTPINAQTPSPTISPASTITDSKNNDSLTEKINSLKDKIASRVAQLNLVEKRGIIGTVIERTDTQISIKDIAGLTRSVDVDEITKFTSPGKTNFGISDIEKNTVIGAVGIYNKESKRILARFVDVINLPIVINGVITKTNKDDFTVSVITEDKKSYTVDIEKITKTNSYSKENNIQRSGFSDILVGERAIVSGYKDKDQKDRLTATRILLFPDYPKNPKIDISIPTESIAPSKITTPSKKTAQ